MRQDTSRGVASLRAPGRPRGATIPAVLPAISVPLRSRRLARARLFQQLQHALPALVLLLDGLQRLSAGGGGVGPAIAVTEVVVSVLVLAFFASAVHQYRAAAVHAFVVHSVDWLDLVLAALFAVEALVHRQETGHLPRPAILMAALMLVLGLFHGRLMRLSERHLSLRVDDDGVQIGGRFFRRFTATWHEITAMEMDASRARLMLKSGRTRRVDLTDLSNAADVQAALAEARRRWRAARDEALAEVTPGVRSGVDRGGAPE
jgi:hypothetical protein